MVAEDIFLTLPVESYRLFLILLHTDLAPLISTRIIEGLTHNPPDWLTKAMAPALDGDRQAHREFLRKYLHAAHQGQIPDDLLKQSSDLLVQSLQELPPERRTEPWVTESINSLCQPEDQGIAQFYERNRHRQKTPSPAAMAGNVSKGGGAGLVGKTKTLRQQPCRLN